VVYERHRDVFDALYDGRSALRRAGGGVVGPEPDHPARVIDQSSNQIVKRVFSSPDPTSNVRTRIGSLALQSTIATPGVSLIATLMMVSFSVNELSEETIAVLTVAGSPPRQ